MRLESVDIHSWLGDRRLLLTSGEGVSLGIMFPDRLEARRVGIALGSQVESRVDGVPYALIDNELLAFDRAGAHFIGRAQCSQASSIEFWLRHVAVICTRPHPTRALIFSDSLTVGH